jgi:Domain of unknown function (DUF6046)
MIEYIINYLHPNFRRVLPFQKESDLQDRSVGFQKESDISSEAVDFGPESTVGSDGVVRRTSAYLGIPVFSDLVLSDKRGVEVYLGEALVNVSQVKNIISTPVVGRNGTIKEYVSDGDFAIKIQGVLASGNSLYPKEAFSDLLELLQTPDAIAVTSWFLQQFNIFNLVITDYACPQAEGFENMQPFEISALSDTPIELVLQE